MPNITIGYIIFILLFCFACTFKNDTLKKLSTDELCQKLKTGDRSFYYASLKDSIGKELSATLKDSLTKGKLIRDFYINKKGDIDEIRVRKLQTSEVFSEIRIRSAMTYPFEQYKFIDLYCDSSSLIIDKAYRNDQNVRIIEEQKEHISEVDISNKNLILSLIEKCGWESLEEEDINKVILIFLHMESEYLGFYYPIFYDYFQKALISPLNYARMIDRLRMNNGFKQIYATQIVKNSFYSIKNVKKLNERRSQLGLGPVEETALKFGFEFKIEDHLKE